MKASLILYGTASCHLCEQAEAVLHGAARLSGSPLPFEKIDIAENPELLERYGIKIPVLREAASEMEIGWPFDAAGIISFIATIQGQAAARPCQNGNDTMANAVVSVTTIA